MYGNIGASLLLGSTWFYMVLPQYHLKLSYKQKLFEASGCRRSSALIIQHSHDKWPVCRWFTKFQHGHIPSYSIILAMSDYQRDPEGMFENFSGPLWPWTKPPLTAWLAWSDRWRVWNWRCGSKLYQGDAEKLCKIVAKHPPRTGSSNKIIGTSQFL